MELSRRQNDVLECIRHHLESNGYPPTLREIGAALGIKSTNAVNDHLKALERKGAIVRDRSRSRGIALAERKPSGVSAAHEVPLLGQIAAGVPLLAEANIERHLQVDAMFGRGRSPDFALRVVGDSMIEEGIFEGDVILVRQQAGEPHRGAVVVALVDGEATVKRFYREPGRIRLQPANATMKPIYVAEDEGRETLVQGLVVGVLRTLDNAG